jgi:hypothetical protein
MDPETCAKCHKKHYQEWSGSMHAYAADDPLFLAMNKRGQREAGIGKFCVNCHAPMAVRTGATEDGLNLGDLPQKLKGVTCYFCHNADDVQGSHDNPIHLSSDNVMRAEFNDPVANTAHGSSYAAILDRDRLESAQFCGSCHDIVNGHGTMIERTFDEWRESVFSQAGVGTTCSQCHMDQSKNLEPAAEAPGVFSRRLHSHQFPGVDLALTTFPEADAQRQAVQAFLNTTLQSSLCVRGMGAGTTLQIILDNVAAGHHWPSGATQDRRAWVQVTAYAGGSPMYQSGAVDVASSMPATALDDPDFWLFRDCLFDDQGKEVHMFWEAASYESNQLPGQLTFNPADIAFYQTHVAQTYPRAGVLKTLPSYPDRVTLRVALQPFGLDVLADLEAHGDLTSADADALRSKLPTFTVGNELEWTAATANETYLDRGLPVSCMSATNLSARADKVPATARVNCKP